MKVSKKASTQEIKSSFRNLAHAFHPDKNPDNDIVSSYFVEIQEAYSVLRNPNARRVYDRERSRIGEGKRDMPPITSSFILAELEKIENVLYSGNRLSVNKELLTDYVLFLLDQNNLSILLRENDFETHKKIIHKILLFSGKLGLDFFQRIEPGLKSLSQQDVEIIDAISVTQNRLKREGDYQKAVPYLVVLLTLLLCLVMYWYAKT